MKEYINKIVMEGDSKDMECLSDMLIDLMSELKERDSEEYKKYKNKLKGIAYNYTIDEELATDIVDNMRPLGEYWSIETIKGAIGNNPHRLEDMYVVMNSLVNDYANVIKPEEVETYIKMADAWIDDIDARDNKLWNYFIR